MMLESAHLQTPFMADLVTLADPTHPLSFLNYIKQQGRLYSFYIRESFFLMRKEYNQYCRWATERLSNLRFNTKVERVEYDQDSHCYHVHCSDTRNGQKLKFETRRLVLGTGPSLSFPTAASQWLNAWCILASIYTTKRNCKPAAQLRWSAAGKARPRSITICSPKLINMVIS